MNILLLKSYNNYFNRILKVEDNLQAYKTASTSYLEFSNINFNPNDGVATELVIGGPTQTDGSSILFWEQDGTPDYLICYENNEIKYRWFIMEAVRTTAGQYKVALKRDVLADKKDILMTSPCFVEKASQIDRNNPLILNSEGMSFNQIKQSEKLLKDSSGCAWLTGYIKKNISTNDLTNVNPINYTSPDTVRTKIIDADELYFSNCIKYIDKSGTIINPTVKDYAHAYNSWEGGNVLIDYLKRKRVQTDEHGYVNLFYNSQGGLYDSNFQTAVSDNLQGAVFKIQKYSDSTQIACQPDDVSAIVRAFAATSENSAAWIAMRTNSLNSLINENNWYLGSSPVTGSWHNLDYQNAVISHDNKLWQLALTSVTRMFDVYLKYNDPLVQTYISWIQNNTPTVNKDGYDLYIRKVDVGSNYSGRVIKLHFMLDILTAQATELVLNETVSLNVPAAALRQTTIDALYDMFTVPIDPSVLGIANDIQTLIQNGSAWSFNIQAGSKITLDFIMLMMTKLGANTTTGSLVYDLQLLPYCPLDIPIETYPSGVSIIDVSELDSGFDYQLINNNNGNYGIIFWCPNANFSKNIELDYQIDGTTPAYSYYSNNFSNVQITPYIDSNSSTGFSAYCTLTVSGLPSGWEVYNFAVNQTSGTTIAAEGARWKLTKISDTSIRLDVETTERSILYINLHLDLSYQNGYTINALDVKISNECELYRLTSPNFNSTFEFKLSKFKDAKINNINIDCTYKPYQPYIKINPDFSWVYGQDFNDATGLILQGDFSIPMLTDAFINYELNNKNYQEIFNRSIKNLDVEQQLQKEQALFSGITGTLTGGIAGGVAGAKAGGITGAVAGAAGGIALGGIGAAIDYNWLTRSQQEARDYKIDNYNYQLGNVKALPESMTKSSPLAYNNKIWPILEKFSCTDKEKELFKEKLKYDGWTCMVIDNLQNYSAEGGFLKGKLIRLNDLDEDFHVADELYKEVQKGFYLW